MNLLTINNENLKEARINQTKVQSEEDIVNSFPSVFDDSFGSLPGEQLVINQQIEPSVNKVRRIPHSLVNDLKKELSKMEEEKVIAKVFEPTQWESGLEKTLDFLIDGIAEIQVDEFHGRVADMLAATNHLMASSVDDWSFKVFCRERRELRKQEFEDLEVISLGISNGSLLFANDGCNQNVSSDYLLAKVSY
eukprot:gene13057-14399_t